MTLLEENDFFEIEICSEEQAYEKLRRESIDVFLLHDENGTLKYIYNSASTSSVNALSVMSKTVDDIQEHIMSLFLLERYGVPIEVSSSRTRSVYEDVYDNEYGSMIIMLIPMVVLAYSCYGVSFIAGEMTVSECERGTFDPLLATGVKKSLLILGQSLYLY